MMCLGNDDPKLTYAQKRDIETAVRWLAANALQNLDVSGVSIVDCTEEEVHALAQAHAKEVRENMTNVFLIEAKYLS